MENNSFPEIWEELKNSKSVLIPLHISPDGDSFGSALVMYYILTDMGKKVTVTSAEKIGGFYDLLDEYKIVKWEVDVAQLDFAEFDTMISLDVSDPFRFLKDGEIKGFTFPSDLRIIVIDHHPGFKYFGALNLHYPEYSSTAEILDDLISNFKFKILNLKFKASKMLLLGILSDTGFLRWAVRPELFEKVSRLMREVNYQDLWNTMLYNVPEGNKRFQGLVLKNVVYNARGRFVYSKITLAEMEQLGIPKTEAGGGSDLLKDVRGYDFSFTITEKELGRVMISFRSQKGVDVSVFARALGNGGGHKAAAGVLLADVSVDEAEKLVLEAIKNSSRYVV